MSTANGRRPVRGRPMRSQTHEAQTTPAERGARALLMRSEGIEWKAIASALGYTAPGGAYGAAMRYALKVAPPTQEQRDAARPRALEMLDQTWSLVEPNLDSSDAAMRETAMRQATQLLDLYARWLGVPASETPKAQRLARYGLRLAVTDGRA